MSEALWTQENSGNAEELLGLDNKKNIKKSNLLRIDISALPDKLPDFRNSEKTKDSILADWLVNWINTGLKEDKIRANQLLPQKNIIAGKVNLSIGTVQTAIRLIEDLGYVESKQRIGTFICDRNNPEKELRKQTSKRENAIEALKKLIFQNRYELGDLLPSSRELSKIIGSAPNTTRLALEYLSNIDIIESKGLKGNKSTWRLKALPQISEVELEASNEVDTDTLVDQVERDLKELIVQGYKIGDKLISHYELADTLKVSIKTVHDAMKRLVEQGILQSKRGRYGTFILRLPSDKQLMTGKESEIFAPAFQASLYNYEKVEIHLKQYIKENYRLDDKLPAMGKLALDLKVSSNTIRKALQRLSEQDIVKFSRGRYGGTFITNLPEDAEEKAASLTWLSINPEVANLYSTKK
ncbi:MAG: GntR family transcriptional regulator [bacterium]